MENKRFVLDTELQQISADGQYMLMLAYDYEGGHYDQKSLIYYNFATPSASRIIRYDTAQVKDAAFNPTHPNQVLIVIEQGVIEFDPLTTQSRILNEVVTSVWAEMADFSPDGKWLGVMHLEADGSET